MAAARKAAEAKPDDANEKAESTSKSKGLMVTAPLVSVLTENRSVLHLRKGDILPSGVTADSVKHLKSLGFVAEAE